MGKMSREKGKLGEREAAKLLRDAGFEARRGQQFSGTETTDDLVHDIENAHIEVKRVESGNLYTWLNQCEEDRGEDDYSLVLHRRNSCDWVGIMYADKLLELLGELQDLRITNSELEAEIGLYLDEY